MRFVDSHLHLSGRDVEPALALGAATETLLVTCATDHGTSNEALRLAAANPEAVKAFVGVHPSEAAKSGGLGWLRKALASSAGLGEVGLDPTYSSAGPRSAQMRAFLSQLELAQKLGKPVQVHSREAEKAAIESLEGFRLRAVLLHWLESEEALPTALAKGYFVSFGPAVLYSKKLQRMAARSEPGQVLAETDSPVTYRPLGGVQGPSLVPSVVFRLAELWGVRFEAARETIAANAARFLGLPEKG